MILQIIVALRRIRCQSTFSKTDVSAHPVRFRSWDLSRLPPSNLAIDRWIATKQKVNTSSNQLDFLAKNVLKKLYGQTSTEVTVNKSPDYSETTQAKVWS